MKKSFVRPGARLLVLGDGRTFGSISGGCIERDVVCAVVAIAPRPLDMDAAHLVRADAQEIGQ